MMPNRIVQLFLLYEQYSDEAEIYEPFITLARNLDLVLEEGPEKTLALRKLLEACDQAVRAKYIDEDNRLRDKNLDESKEVLFTNLKKDD